MLCVEIFFFAKRLCNKTFLWFLYYILWIYKTKKNMLKNEMLIWVVGCRGRLTAFLIHLYLFALLSFVAFYIMFLSSLIFCHKETMIERWSVKNLLNHNSLVGIGLIISQWYSLSLISAKFAQSWVAKIVIKSKKFFKRLNV